MSGLAWDVLKDIGQGQERSVFTVVQVPDKAGVWAILFIGGEPVRLWTQVEIQSDAKTDQEIKRSIRLQLEKDTI